MKHHATGRPIGKCKACCLNMRTFCAAGLDPKSEWSRHKCTSRDDQALLEAYFHPDPVTGAKAAKQRRRAIATTAASEPHHDGVVFAPARGSARRPRR